jgi:hypothetical protein
VVHRYNVGGAILWAVLFVGAGYLFGNLPFVQVLLAADLTVPQYLWRLHRAAGSHCTSAAMHVWSLTSLPCLVVLQHNFAAVVGAIVAVSVLPIIYEVWAARKEDTGAIRQGDLETR